MKTKVTQKRYQHYTINGIEWTDWFNYKGDTTEKWQIKNKLRNEYRTIKIN